MVPAGFHSDPYRTTDHAPRPGSPYQVAAAPAAAAAPPQPPAAALLLLLPEVLLPLLLGQPPPAPVPLLLLGQDPQPELHQLLLQMRLQSSCAPLVLLLLLLRVPPCWCVLGEGPCCCALLLHGSCRMTTPRRHSPSRFHPALQGLCPVSMRTERIRSTVSMGSTPLLKHFQVDPPPQNCMVAVKARLLMDPALPDFTQVIQLMPCVNEENREIQD